MALLEPGTVSHLMIQHDDWCAIFWSGDSDLCDCEPIATLLDDDSFKRAQRANRNGAEVVVK
jgi:hypothetical protein